MCVPIGKVLRLAKLAVLEMRDQMWVGGIQGKVKKALRPSMMAVGMVIWLSVRFSRKVLQQTIRAVLEVGNHMRVDHIEAAQIQATDADQHF